MKISVIFGAGENAVKARNYIELHEKNGDKLFYCDNYKRGELDGTAVIDYKELKKLYTEHEVSVYIVSARFQEIYEQCVVDQIEIKGIYDAARDTVLDYYAYCFTNRTGYSNDRYIEYIHEMDERNRRSIDKFRHGAALSECFTEVAVMISNLCNYACIHKKCPASRVKEKEIMSTEKFQSIILQLKELDFKGTVTFHIYNDPMIDPRLFMLALYVKEQLPGARTLVYTNGYYLNQDMVEELERLPVDILTVTGYGKEEYERLLSLDIHIPFKIYYGNLDDRLENYDIEGNKENKTPCRSLIAELPIYTNGDIGLCCMDYKHTYGLGNIFESGLKTCIDSEKIRRFQEGLLDGDRSMYELCSRCSWVI